MAGFVYLIDKVRRVNPKTLSELDLSYAFDGSIATREVVAKSNGIAANGCVIGDSSLLPVDRPIAFEPDEQTWLRIPTLDDGPARWVGYWNDSPPQPDELFRDTPLRTAGLILDDGRQWRIPIVGHPENNKLASDLPAWLALDEEGKRVRGEVVREYEQLWETVSSVADKQFAFDAKDSEHPPTDDEQWNATVECLQAVYRVDQVELIAMRAFIEGSDKLALAWMIATNYDWLIDMLDATAKKNGDAAPSGVDISHGKTD